MYAVQNDTEIMFNIVLYINYFHWAGVGIQKAQTDTQSANHIRLSVNRGNHYRSKRDPESKTGVWVG